MPPKLSPKTQTMRPQAILESPARRDQLPRGATRSHTPIPTWIHTAEAGAVMGWLLQIVPPTLTRCCTQLGEDAALGWITCVVIPRGIEACICRRPSKIQRNANETRSNHRAAGSAGARSSAGCPSPLASRRIWIARSTFHPRARSAKSNTTTNASCLSRDWNAATIVGSFVRIPVFIPGMPAEPPRSDSIGSRLPVLDRTHRSER